MKKTWVCWSLAVVLTLGSVAWQRLTGPTHPAKGEVSLDGKSIAFKLDRSASISGNQPVSVTAPDNAITGEVRWRRFPTVDAWQAITMDRNGDTLFAELPKQPAAGKLEYQVRLAKGAEEVVFPTKAAVTRFRGDVPNWVLIPHILAMFVGMLFSMRAGIEAMAGRENLKGLSWAAFVLLVVGGFILGPAVQKYAFDAWWTGVPFGWDLTDNKTLIAIVAWVWALWAIRKPGEGRWSVLAASVATLLVFAIPHSVWGSEIKWNSAPPK